ncbi:Kunitz/Bovine pancreatic trypsin inhibitor domain protein [Dictyocaulus viviparus]|uniref:Kunitz/Bovine pancreatic trypsin inhibitor domain protein n=1 Tax=Dictyocaulus viviparus TaxID=29172 RepID=A0A0D8XUA0_DICVI|nr:Kunitz/Bovine pancreatic trypsin inhibitor domain protein [Dictyocaulus viviparus]
MRFLQLYDTSTLTPSVTVLSNSIDSRVVLDPIIAPSSPVNSNAPGHEPHPPAAQAAKTVIQSDEARQLPVISANSPETKKNIYKADPIPAKPDPTGNEGFPLVGPSPPMSVNYQTGEVRNRVNGIRTFQESSGRVTVEDSDLTEDEEVQRRNLLSCPNGLQEMRYSDGRPVMCLPGKNQCPEKSVCYFNGLDFFCCPNEEDPYDKHVFGGYDGEETKHGYKVFGPLNIRRLMDEVPLRTRRMANPRRSRREAASNTILRSAPESFNLDSIVAPLRFDDEKPRQVSRAQRMRSKPSPPNHGNPICVEPLSQGDCDSAHLRYYYDRETDTCRLFYYSGCKGNNNNFGSLNDCQKLCVLGGQRELFSLLILTLIDFPMADVIDKQSLYDLIFNSIGPRPQYQLTTSSSTSVPRGYCPDGTAPLGGSTPVLCGNSTDSIACPVGFYCLNGPPDVCCPYNKLEETG